MVYYFFYKTTNLINNKIYYGVHTTNNLNDGYLGSGKWLKRAFKKYGKENFHIEILKFFKCKSDMFDYEKEFITEEIINDKNTYNLTKGGRGGYNDITDDGKERISKHRKNKVVAKDKNGIIEVVSKEIFDSSNEYQGHTKGYVVAKDKNGNVVRTKINDPRYIQGDIEPLSKGIVIAKNLITGKILSVTKEQFENDPNLVGSTYGSKQTKESNLKRSIKQKGIPKPRYKVTCPHCEKIGDVTNMKRWHFDNCKNKTN